LSQITILETVAFFWSLQNLYLIIQLVLIFYNAIYIII
jgi:hypothetical protein